MTDRRDMGVLCETCRTLTDDTPAIVRVFCGKHDRAVAVVKETRSGTALIAWRPYRHRPKLRAQRHNPRALAEFEGILDLDEHLAALVDGPDSAISKAWCRKGPHPVALDPAALRAAVADYRRGAGVLKLIV